SVMRVGAGAGVGAVNADLRAASRALEEAFVFWTMLADKAQPASPPRSAAATRRAVERTRIARSARPRILRPPAAHERFFDTRRLSLALLFAWVRTHCGMSGGRAIQYAPATHGERFSDGRHSEFRARSRPRHSRADRAAPGFSDPFRTWGHGLGCPASGQQPPARPPLVRP